MSVALGGVEPERNRRVTVALLAARASADIIVPLRRSGVFYHPGRRMFACKQIRFQPPTRPQLELDLPPATKLIDPVLLLLEPDPEDRLSNSIIDFVATLQLEAFNQSSYEPLRTVPSGAFVKPRPTLNGYSETQAQLGVWLAAGSDVWVNSAASATLPSLY
ncbi:hypothetical protein GGR58DRAFT_507002 [Xylaria digitata]|nr:hypothetical protein GGR58DRAFT_507002 [Xylaria digitata]